MYSLVLKVKDEAINCKKGCMHECLSFLAEKTQSNRVYCFVLFDRRKTTVLEGSNKLTNEERENE